MYEFDSRKIAEELLKVAKELQASEKIKVDYIKYGEICFSYEMKFGKDDSLDTIANRIQYVNNQLFAPVKLKLDHGNLLDFDTGYTRAEIKNNAIVAKMYYGGQFEIDEAKAALKEIGIK